MNRIRALLSSVALAVLAVGALSCGNMGVDQYSITFPEKQGKIDANGLRIIILPDPSTPLVQVDVRYEVGAKEDPPGRGGIAHLVEHMMFQQKPAGEDKPELFKVLQQFALFMNAYTSWDKTHYQNLVRKEDLEPILAIESARMALGCKTIVDAQFQREREVVRNEFRQNYGGRDAIVFFKIHEIAYPEGHPYHRLPIGTDDELTAITFDDVCKFMEDYYTPSRATLVIAGNITPEEVAPLIEKYFGGIPAREPKPRVEVPLAVFKKQKIVIEADVDETTVTVMWAMPKRYSDDDAAAQAAISAVFGRVAQEARDWEFATGVQPIDIGGDYAPAKGIIISLRSPGDVDKALDAVWRASKSAHKRFEEVIGEDARRELGNEIARLKADIFMTMEDALGERTELYADYAQYGPERGYLAGELGRLDKLDPYKFRGFIKKAVSPDKAIVLIVKAKEGGEKVKASSKRYQATTPDNREEGLLVDVEEAKRRLDVPAVIKPSQAARTFTMGNGMKVILQPTDGALPVMSARLVFNVGSAHEKPRQAGLAGFAARALNPPQIDAGQGGDFASANVLGEVGAEYGGSATTDHTTFFVRGLSIYEDKLIIGLERWIKVGEYNQGSVESYAQGLRFAMKRRGYRANLNFQREAAAALYGADHPYALTGIATPESVGHFGRDALMDFKSWHYRAGNATLIVAGRFDVARVERLIKGNFGEWSHGNEDKLVQPVSHQVKAAYIGVEGEEDLSVQAFIGYPAAAGVDGQFAARLILAEMLNARVAVIRETLGSSYGIRALLERRRAGGAYVIAGAIDAVRAGESLRAIRAGFQSLRDGTDFDATFVKARRNVLKRYITDSGTANSASSRILFVVTFGLADGYYDKLIRLIAATSPEQVKALVAEELAPEREQVILLGSKRQVEIAFTAADMTMTKFVPVDDEKK